jgi:hypothetical protein
VSLVRVGPVVVDHGDPEFSWTSDPNAAGMRGATFGGSFSWRQAAALSELIARDNPVTILDVTGTLEHVHFDDDLLRSFTGWYLFQPSSLDAAQQHSLVDLDGDVPFSVKAVLVPSALVPVYIRSARRRPNQHGLGGRTTVASAAGFLQSTGGGPSFTRSYDAARIGETPRPALVTISPGSLAFGDTMSSVVIPVDAAELDVPGLRPCGYDRRTGREVYGPAHPFEEATDAMVENGLLRLWCGPVGLVPYVSVAAWSGGGWTEVGNLAFAGEGDDLIAPPRITRCTAFEVSLSLHVRRLGRVTLTLVKAKRLVYIDYGSTRPGIPDILRFLRWLGMPPARAITGATATASARFGAGVALAAEGQLGFAWPPGQPVTGWAYSSNWTPAAASATQPDSGLWSLWSGGVAVGTVRFDTATNTIRWTQGANTLSTAALVFSAGDHIHWSVSFSDSGGMTLTTSINGAAPVVVTNPAFVDAGGGTFDSHWIGYTTEGFGSGDFGDGDFGGDVVTASLGGAVSDGILFDGQLTAAEAGALAQAVVRGASWPAPLSRAIGYWPFAPRPTPRGSAEAAGRRFEATAAGGSTRSPDASGLTKGLGVLTSDTSGADSAHGFGVGRTGTQLLAGAWLATTDTDDDLADHHDEFAAANRVDLSMMQEA